MDKAKISDMMRLLAVAHLVAHLYKNKFGVAFCHPEQLLNLFD